MTAIAGCLFTEDSRKPELQCGRILSALARFGGTQSAVRRIDDVCFGRLLRSVVPEDDYDRQPLIGGGGRYLMVADARIDNRDELAALLHIDSQAAANSSDADLLLAAWEKFQLRSFSHLLGDIAVAVWDVRDQRLTLARSAIAQKPLFYHLGKGFVAFASMPQGLHALDEIPKRLDFGEAAAIAAGLPHIGTSTLFDGVEMVRHGHAVEIRQGRASVIRTWDLDRIEPGSFKSADCAEALRAETDRAVGAQLRGREGQIAAQLSSGRDSSAVAGTAAMLLRDEGDELLAMTGAPRLGFQSSMPGRLADESSLAAETARLHENVTHVICRTTPRSIGNDLRSLSQMHFGPMLNIAGINWNLEVAEEAQRRKVAVMLIGSTGNFSISAGGINHLRSILSQRGFAPWLSTSARMAGQDWRKWRAIGSLSFGPSLPQTLYRLILIMSNRRPDEGFGVPILRRPYRECAESLLADFYADVRPPRDYYSFRRKMLLKRDNSEKMSEALWGFDVRDPTADRRLVELCLSFPADQLVSATDARPAYNAAFADRIPARVINSNIRGVQGADWAELFQFDEIEAMFAHYRRNALVSELIDFDYIDALMRQWPAQGPELFGALGIADFVELHFG